MENSETSKLLSKIKENHENAELSFLENPQGGKVNFLLLKILGKITSEAEKSTLAHVKVYNETSDKKIIPLFFDQKITEKRKKKGKLLDPFLITKIKSEVAEKEKGKMLRLLIESLKEMVDSIFELYLDSHYHLIPYAVINFADNIINLQLLKNNISFNDEKERIKNTLQLEFFKKIPMEHYFFAYASLEKLNRYPSSSLTKKEAYSLIDFCNLLFEKTVKTLREDFSCKKQSLSLKKIIELFNDKRFQIIGGSAFFILVAIILVYNFKFSTLPSKQNVSNDQKNNQQIVAPTSKIKKETPKATLSEPFSDLFYSFDEGSGKESNDVSRARMKKINLKNGTTFTEGINKGALYFNGTNHYGEILNDKGFLNIYEGSLTIQVWVKPLNIEKISAIVAKDKPEITAMGNYFLGIQNKKILFGYSPDAGTDVWYESEPVLKELDKWYHIAVTHEFSSIKNSKIYVNGIETKGNWKADGPVDENYKLSLPRVFSDQPLNIGRSSCNGYYFYGTIDELKIQNSLISKEEIIKNFKLSSKNTEVE